MRGLGHRYIDVASRRRHEHHHGWVGAFREWFQSVPPRYFHYRSMGASHPSSILYQARGRFDHRWGPYPGDWKHSHAPWWRTRLAVNLPWCRPPSSGTQGLPTHRLLQPSTRDHNQHYIRWVLTEKILCIGSWFGNAVPEVQQSRWWFTFVMVEWAMLRLLNLSCRPSWRWRSVLRSISTWGSSCSCPTLVTFATGWTTHWTSSSRQPDGRLDGDRSKEIGDSMRRGASQRLRQP